MRRWLISAIMAIGLIAGGWAVYHRDQIGSAGDAVQLARTQLQSITQPSRLAGWSESRDATIRIASFPIDAFRNEPLPPELAPLIADIVRQFDVIAVQQIGGENVDRLPAFLDEVNRTGRRYRYVIKRTPDRGGTAWYSAFFYDSETIQMDGSGPYTLSDPDGLLRHEPLVGWFRAGRVPPDQAFTFTLVSLQLDEANPWPGALQLHRIFRLIRNDGRGEDDVILAGSFYLDGPDWNEVVGRPGWSRLINDIPTDTRQSHSSDNILIDRRATTEYTGRAGVLDFLSKYNLTMDEALRISQHLPVWAEFSLREGDIHQRVARSFEP